MDENGDGEDLTPFWLQNTTNTRCTNRLRRRASSLFFSSGVMVFLLLVIAVFFLVFVLPSTLSFSTQFFRPNNVKKSWDSLNIGLVLVAVVFGFLSRIKNEDKYDEFQSSPIKQNEEVEAHKPKPSNAADQWFNFNTIETQKPSTSYSNPDQWYEHLDDKDPFLKRNSSSYPDLREFSSNRYDYTRIFNDDLNLDSSHVLDPMNHHHRRHRSVSQIESFETIPKKTIIIDTLATRSEKATTSTPPPPTTSPPPEYQEKIQTERVVHRKERLSTKQKKESEHMNPFPELKPPLTPSPEQTPATVEESPEFQEMSNLDYQNVRYKARLSRKLNTTPPPPPTPPPVKLSNKKSATKDFLNSLYNKKKKKPRQKSVENLDSLIHQSQQPITVHFSPPPLNTVAPPPPPPPPTAFQNIFLTKKQKRKRTISVTFLPPPPPPPPPPSRTPAKSPTTRKMKLEENSNSGGESPLSRIPPPPPPPPAYFKNPAWKFVVQGDYVRVNSSNSSRCGSPDIDDVESDVTPLSDEGGLLTPFHPSPAFCQSPDVNSKAESFITSFRAKLKLEKAHSMNGRQLGPSGLGRSSGSGPRRI